MKSLRACAGMGTVLLVVSCLLFSQAGPAVNQDSLVLKDFDTRVSNYLKLHQEVLKALPPQKQTDSADKLGEYRHQLAAGIRTARSNAKRGDLFTPEVSVVFRHLLATPLSGSERGRVKASLKHAEPVKEIPLEVNGQYPPQTPLQSTPPTLLLNLPHLPPQLEYRIVGRDLILRDVDADLVVDFISKALPAAQKP